MNLSDLDILYEDAHIIVCHKPAGVATQSARINSPDMVSILKNHLFRTNAQKQNPYLAVIHRLDQPVEGILVFAKTPFAAKQLNKELQTGGFGKHYHAHVMGHPKKPQDTLENYMVKDSRTNTSRICSKNTPGAKLARLSYYTISEDEHSSFLDITLDTGRHHQIRLQLAEMGCPIVGDQKYGEEDLSQRARPLGPLELCAYKLEFHHPKTQKLMTFSL